MPRRGSVLLAAVAFAGIASAAGAVGGSSGIPAGRGRSVVAFPVVEKPHGPYFESTRDLNGAPPLPHYAAHPVIDEDAVQHRADREMTGSGAQSPAPTAGPFDVTGGGNDPQIAASETHLVVTTNGEIGFYAKSGRLLTTDHLGNAMRNPITPFDFFHHFWNGRRDPTNIDFGLRLPPGTHCDVTNKTPKGDPPDACIDQVYDTRVVFDEFRKRFWLVASARNAYDKDFHKLKGPAQFGRRSFILVAVSRTQDPRDGWTEWWWPAVPDQGACSQVIFPETACPGTQYAPGDAADLPSIGVSKDFVVETIGVEGRTDVHVLNPEGLMIRRPCLRICVLRYSRISTDAGDPGKHLEPAVQHDEVKGGWTVMTYYNGGGRLLLGVRASEGPLPPLHGASVSIPDSSEPRDGPQFLSGEITYTNRVRDVLRAVMHGPELVTASQDCVPRGSSECGTAVRVIRVNAKAALDGRDVVPTLDTTVGGQEKSFPTFDGDPSLDVDASGDIVVSFLRTAPRPRLFPAARYAVIRSGRVERSHLLHTGSANFGKQIATSRKIKGSGLDTGGAATDPSFLRDGVWVLHAYGMPEAGSEPTRGTWGYAFAKVLGQTHPDLTVDGGKLIKTSRPVLLLGRQVIVTVPVFDDGDGSSGPVTVKAFLDPRNGDRRVKLGTSHLGALVSGGTKTASIKGTVRVSLKPGHYLLEIEITPQHGEYSAANNTAETSVDVAPVPG